MDTAKVDLTGVRWTLLVTLYLRAIESRSKDSILRDHAAAEALRRIDYNFGSLKMRLTAGDRYLVVLRARQLDAWAADVLSRHPDATVVQLGCGLDSRAFRLNLPPGARWFDVDFPDVIDLRRRLYPERDRYRMIGSSVTEPAWLEEIPTDRPVLVIAEGVLMYLTEDDVRQLLRRLTDRFTSGSLIFDGVHPWIAWTSNRLPGPYGGFKMGWAIRDVRDVERLNPRLRHVADTPVVADFELVPVRFYRVLYRLLSRFPAMRDAMRLFRFEF
jgi:methyltransferase (TIGR00027 family)